MVEKRPEEGETSARCNEEEEAFQADTRAKAEGSGRDTELRRN